MAALIARVRAEIGDDGSPQVFDQDAIQDHLDRYRGEIRYALLTPRPSPQPGGPYAYFDYYSGLGDWEDDWSIVDAGWNPVTPIVAEPIAGHWRFAGPPPGQLPPVRITGKVYSYYLTCADLCDVWATKLSRKYNFSTDGQRFDRSDMRKGLRESAAAFRMRATAISARLVQTDAMPDDSGYPSNYWESAADPLDVRYGI